jgi:hypothetical protein
MTPAQALIELRAHPRKWLEKHYLKAYAGVPATFSAQQPSFGNTGYVNNVAALGPIGPVFDRSPGTAKTFGPWTGTDRRAFTFDRVGGQAAFVGAVVPATAINIPVIGSATFNGNYVGIPLDDLGNAAALNCDFAITTLLNGCSFIIDGANPSVRHVQPVGITAAALRNALHPNYGTVFGGGANEYDETIEDVTVIGVRRGAGWKIYAQVHTRNVRNVLRVVKLHG